MSKKDDKLKLLVENVNEKWYNQSDNGGNEIMTIINAMENITVSEEYFKILLGGLFGVATIVVAILSIASNIINGKCLNMYVNKMTRYRITFCLLPIYFLLFYTFLSMFFRILATNICCIIGFTLIFMGIVTHCSYLVAQYVIDIEEFQATVLKISKKKLKREIKGDENRNQKIIEYMLEANKNINTDGIRLFVDVGSRKTLYCTYIELLEIETLDEKELTIVLGMLLEELSINKAPELYDTFKAGQLMYVLLRRMIENPNEENIQDCIERVHSYITYRAIEDRGNDEYERKINLLNQKALLYINNYLESTLDYIIKRNFTMQDAFYLATIISQVYAVNTIRDLTKIELPTDISKFLYEVLEAEKDFKWKQSRNGKDEVIKTAYNILEGNINE